MQIVETKKGDDAFPLKASECSPGHFYRRQNGSLYLCSADNSGAPGGRKSLMVLLGGFYCSADSVEAHNMAGSKFKEVPKGTEFKLTV